MKLFFKNLTTPGNLQQYEVGRGIYIVTNPYIVTNLCHLYMYVPKKAMGHGYWKISSFPVIAFPLKKWPDIRHLEDWLLGRKVIVNTKWFQLQPQTNFPYRVFRRISGCLSVVFRVLPFLNSTKLTLAPESDVPNEGVTTHVLCWQLETDLLELIT